VPFRALLSRVFLVGALALCAAVAAPALAGATPYAGVQLHSLWSDSTNADMDQELALSAQAHSNVVRVDVGWATLEAAGKGQYADWYVQKLDRFMAGASAQGMKVIITLWGTPCWASSAPDSIKQGCTGWANGVVQYAPTNASDYADIARWITSRYGSQMAALEIWNEPNLANGTFWVSGAAAYANLVKAAYPAAKAGNANVAVIAGALSGADTSYLNTLYANGIRGSEDGISVHAYAEERGFPGLGSVHDAMGAAGDNTKVWVTEFGWPTGTNTNWHVSEADQATNITNGFNDLTALPWVQAGVLYDLHDEGTDPSNMEDNFGVIHRDYTAKPGYQALTDVLAQTAGKQTTPPPPAPAPGPPISPGLVATVRNVNAAAPLQLALVERPQAVYAVVRAPRGSTVVLTVSRCRVHGRGSVTRTRAPRGHVARRLGRRTRLAGCQVRATLAHPHHHARTVTARVR
jgi:hypothetical protein